MDAKVGDWVVTPRRGKPVEINALWHNALVLLESWLVREGRGLLADGLAREARRCRDAFNARFWNPARGHLFDIVDGDHGDDDACRPNQVLAVAVTHPPLDRVHWEAVLQAVADELLTPVGLRTLSPRHPDYKARYFGDLRDRDAAYHQGTVWPWLIGPFLDAWLLVHPADTEGARDLLEPLLQHVVNGGCVGSVSEIFDAQPPYVPRGCFAQAWSVAELGRMLVRLSKEKVPADEVERAGTENRAGVEG
jgi:glycogen debranching enzyme